MSRLFSLGLSAQQLRQLADTRSARAVVREERLRTVAGLRGSPALALSAWRGRSGRRYVVGVHQADSFAASADYHYLSAAIVIAVRRNETGHAELIRATCDLSAPRAWIDSLLRAGATEFHVHQLADAEAERKAIVADVSPLASEMSPQQAVEAHLTEARHFGQHGLCLSSHAGA